MAKKGQISHYAAQKAAKPDVRELIDLTCDGEVRTRALELLAFFQSLRMKPAWASTNSYALSYKGKRVGYFKLGRGDKFARNCLDIQIYPIENYDAFLRGRTEDERRCSAPSSAIRSSDPAAPAEAARRGWTSRCAGKPTQASVNAAGISRTRPSGSARSSG